MEDIVGDVDDQSLIEELESCKNFLTDTEVENGRHRVFNFAMSSFHMSLLKLDYVFKELKCATKVNLKDRMQRMDNWEIDICTRERANTKWNFYKLTNLTNFVSLLKDVPMGCKDTVLPEPLLRNCNVNCLTFERKTTRQPYNDSLYLFRALALHLHGNEKLEEETSKIFNLFLNNSEEGDVSKFQGVHLKDIPNEVSSVEEVFKIMKRVSSFYATTIIFATSTTSTLSSNPSGVLRVTHSSRRRGIWNNIWLLKVIVLNIFTQRMFANWEKRFLESWMHSTFHIEMSKNCSRTWQYLILSPFVSRKTHTSKLKLQRVSGSVCLYQFLSRQTCSGNPFSSAMPILIISSRLLSLLSKD